MAQQDSNELQRRIGIGEHRDPHVVQLLRASFATLGFGTAEVSAEDELTILLLEKRSSRPPVGAASRSLGTLVSRSSSCLVPGSTGKM